MVKDGFIDVTKTELRFFEVVNDFLILSLTRVRPDSNLLLLVFFVRGFAEACKDCVSDE